MTDSDNVFDKTGELSRKIVYGMFPDETHPRGAYDLGLGYGTPQDAAADAAHRSWRPSAIAKADVVYDASELSVGEIFILIDEKKSRGEYYCSVSECTTTRQALGRHSGSNSRLHVVTAKTAKMAKVASLSFGWWNYDLATLQAPTDAAYNYAISGSTAARTLVRTGYTLVSLLAAITSHKDFAKWQTLRAQCVVEQAKHDAKREAEQKAQAAKEAPVKSKVRTLNQALGVPVVTAKTYGDMKVEIDDSTWTTKRNITRLVPLALAGRLDLGEITREQYDAAMSVYAEIDGA